MTAPSEPTSWSEVIALPTVAAIIQVVGDLLTREQLTDLEELNQPIIDAVLASYNGPV